MKRQSSKRVASPQSFPQLFSNFVFNGPFFQFLAPNFTTNNSNERMNHTVFRVMERNTCKVLFYRKKTNRTGQKNHHQRNPLSVQVPIARRPGCEIPKPTKHRIRVSRHSIDEKQKDIPSQKLKHEFIKSLSLPFQPPLTCFPAVSVLRSKK